MSTDSVRVEERARVRPPGPRGQRPDRGERVHDASDGFVVSVIIPVHNAAPYVGEAVASALAQPETGEVILVEDGSSDGSLEVCRSLADRHARVRLLRHPGGGNRGAGASRNLGIAEASGDLIAFLDADDFYLPGRFDVARDLLQADSSLDGVYEATGFHLENEDGKAQWAADRPAAPLTTVTEKVPPDQLFERMGPVGNAGWFTTLGIVVRRSVFDRTGFFDEGLRVHQDTAMWLKMAAVARLAPGRLSEPVAMYRWHGGNHSMGQPEALVRTQWLQFWVTMWRWSRRNLPAARQRALLDRFLRYAAGARRSRVDRLRAFVRVGRLIFRYPDLALEPGFWRFSLGRLRSLIPIRQRLPTAFLARRSPGRHAERDGMRKEP